jgi:hypothetical protein
VGAISLCGKCGDSERRENPPLIPVEDYESLGRDLSSRCSLEHDVVESWFK